MKKNTGTKIFLLVAAGILILYLAAAVFFHSHFFLRTSLNGVDVSGKTISDVKTLITEEIRNYELVLEERGEQEEILKGTDIALEPEFGDSIDQLLDKQNMFAWPSALFHKTILEEETMVEYDEKALANQIAALQCMQTSHQIAPKDAAISEYSKADGFTIVKETMGTTLDASKVSDAVTDAVGNLVERLSLEGANCYVDPAVFSDDETLIKQADTLNQYVKASITYEVGSDSDVLDGSIISGWLDISEGSVSINETALANYVDELASKYNTAFRKRTLKTSYGPTITIQGGDYGWKIDKEAEKEQLKADIESGQAVKREPNYSRTANSHGENDYGDSYVEINLTAQHLFLYSNGTRILDTDFVSGNTSNGNGTPVGAYGLTYKERDATLNGENYSTPVSYWMPYCGNVGMHDASWRSSFGGNIYTTNGSHGCVNLPPSAAKTIYSYVDTNYPVLVYELPGTGSVSNEAAAAEVVNLINLIGPVTLESETAMNTAQQKYNALSAEGKALVGNYATLQDDYAQLAALKAAAGIQ